MNGAEADWNEITGIMNRFYQTCRESGKWMISPLYLRFTL